MSIYTLKADDYFVINSYLNRFKKDYPDYIIKTYDFELLDEELLFNELNTLNFLEPHKIILIKNYKYHKDSLLSYYLDNPNPNNILIFVSSEPESILKKKTKVIESTISIYDLISENLDGYNMDYETKRFFVDYYHHDISSSLNALDKIKAYKGENKKIQKEDIEITGIYDLDNNIFNLLDYIGSKDEKNMLKTLEYLVLIELEDINRIIYMISESFRIMYQGKILKKDGYKRDDIIKMIGVNPFRYDKTMSNQQAFSLEKIMHILNDLADLDIKIKKGEETTGLLVGLLLGI